MYSILYIFRLRLKYNTTSDNNLTRQFVWNTPLTLFFPLRYFPLKTPRNVAFIVTFSVFWRLYAFFLEKVHLHIDDIECHITISSCLLIKTSLISNYDKKSELDRHPMRRCTWANRRNILQWIIEWAFEDCSTKFSNKKQNIPRTPR